MTPVRWPAFHARRRPLTVALALALAALGLAASQIASSRHAEAESRLRQTQRTSGDARMRLQAAEDALAARRSLVAAATLLRDQGPALEPDRPVWLDTLHRARRAQHLAPLSAELGPHRPLEGAAGFDASALTLKGTLVHEGQLLRLLDALDALPGTLRLPRRCRLERLDAPPTADPDARLQADCLVELVTLHPAPSP